MTAEPAHAIGRSLARLGQLAVRSTAADDGAPSSREAIFDVLARAEEPLTIERICLATGLHPNTVRGHLEVLVAAGRVHREAEAPRGRGRPPWLFTAAPEGREQRHRLAGALVRELRDAESPDLAREAAERWVAALPAESRTPAGSPDEAVGAVAGALGELGFEASVGAVGDRIELRGCPYASLVSEHPVICDIHAAVVAELLEGAEQGVTLRRLDVWARPGLCVVHLARPDLRPARVVRLPAANPPETHIPN